eukprot:GHRQ01034879.1.p1 GENE.GHRQ01034879.1~~GHRQ01034879.1.p1  ORF type:complete len:164 (-),score=7.47 GHRQ01034879.1:55-546(-)
MDVQSWTPQQGFRDLCFKVQQQGVPTPQQEPPGTCSTNSTAQGMPRSAYRARGTCGLGYGRVTVRHSSRSIHVKYNCSKVPRHKYPLDAGNAALLWMQCFGSGTLFSGTLKVPLWPVIPVVEYCHITPVAVPSPDTSDAVASIRSCPPSPAVILYSHTCSMFR